MAREKQMSLLARPKGTLAKARMPSSMISRVKIQRLVGVILFG